MALGPNVATTQINDPVGELPATTWANRADPVANSGCRQMLDGVLYVSDGVAWNSITGFNNSGYFANSVSTQPIASKLLKIMTGSGYMYAPELAAMLGTDWPAKADFYVDSVSGSDTNPGTKNSPKQTLGSITPASGLVVALKRGSEFRATFAMSQPGMILTAYGTGLYPRILGSTKVVTAWVNTVGSEYTTSPGITPLGVFVLAGDSVTRLRKGTAGALTTNQWAFSAGTLTVNIGANPTSSQVEMTVAGATNGVGITAANCIVANVLVGGHTANGIEYDLGGSGSAAISCLVYGNANDGINAIAGASCAQNTLTRGCTVIGNGTTDPKSGLGADGDGVSFHSGSNTYTSGNIENCYIADNFKSGIGHQSGCICTATGNTLTNNYNNIMLVGVTTPGSQGSLTCVNNILFNTSTADNNNFAFFTSAIPTACSLTLYNNSCYLGGVGTTKNLEILNVSSNVKIDIQNNIFVGGNRGIDYRGSATIVNFGYNVTFGAATNIFDNSTGALSFLSASGTTHLLTDPLYTSGSTGNMTLGTGSPSKNTGTPLGIYSDIANTVRASRPSRGAVE